LYSRVHVYAVQVWKKKLSHTLCAQTNGSNGVSPRPEATIPRLQEGAKGTVRLCTNIDSLYSVCTMIRSMIRTVIRFFGGLQSACKR